MIQSLELKNFTAFKHIRIEFSPKINVIIGENGTGKSHLLKGAYALASCGSLFNKNPEFELENLAKELTEKLLLLFLPIEDKLWKLRRTGETEQAEMEATFDPGHRLSCSFNTNSKSLSVTSSSNLREYKAEPVFIPTKEVLAFMKGFVSLYEKYGLSFDQSYRDVCLLLDLPAMRQENLHQKSIWAIDEIEKVCGGRFIFYGGGNVTFKTQGTEYSANVMAEGFRKAGMLSRLLETGAIQPGVSGPLFWDEPESNMNPKLLKLLVEILLELARNGQQIILATHDYVLLKWLDLLMDKGKDDQVRFHSFSRDLDTNEISLATTDEYLSVTPNPIDEAFGQLINREIENDMGGLGR